MSDHRFFDAAFLRKLAALSLAAGRVRATDGGGLRRADRRGGRVEFAEHRAYAPGDDIRDVDWAAAARTGRLHVKEYERRGDASCLVVVDSSASMALHGKRRAAMRIAWAIAWVALGSEGGAAVATAAAGRLDRSTKVRTRAAVDALAKHLLAAEPAGGTALTASLGRIPPATRGSRVVVLVSDLLAEDDGRRALASIAERGDTVGVVHLVAREDWVPPDGAASVVDAETGEEVPIDAGAAARAAARAARSEREWCAFAARHRIRYVRADPSAPDEETVMRALRSGGILS